MYFDWKKGFDEIFNIVCLWVVELVNELGNGEFGFSWLIQSCDLLSWVSWMEILEACGMWGSWEKWVHLPFVVVVWKWRGEEKWSGSFSDFLNWMECMVCMHLKRGVSLRGVVKHEWKDESQGWEWVTWEREERWRREVWIFLHQLIIRVSSRC
jgi:hypothetical protein